MFREVSSKANLPRMEEDILRFWRERRIFEQSVTAREGQQLYAFYDGPPTTNGSPGIHHVLSRLFKDVPCRYKAMKGYHVPRKAGWDTHGLPVELEVESLLGLTKKSQIEEYGVAQFNQRCRESVFKYIGEWRAMVERIGHWIDMDDPYITLENGYIESCWWAMKQLWDRDLIYRGYKTTPHCPRCGTSLSSHEVALGYEDNTEDPSVYIRFRLSISSLFKGKSPLGSILEAIRSGEKPAFILAWTTTPWTLPGNTALAVATEANYSVMESEADYLIMATGLTGQLRLENYKEAGVISGSDLVDLEYEPLFNPHDFDVPRFRMPSFTVQEKREDLRYPVIGGDFVSLEEGTGVVHVAPSFGEVDFDAGMEVGLDFVQPVDLEGRVTGGYSFAGTFVKDADALVLDDLKSRGLLFRSETIIHTYPFCWRCGSPLLYYVKRSWYIKTTMVKDRLISGNAEVNWYPDYIKHGRFGDWLANNVDWAFSRERYWGTPLNIWQCSSCGHSECVGGVDELRAKPNVRGLKAHLDLHRPYVDEIAFSCCECGADMWRVPEVIDCWFDSGAMIIAQWHYPFENIDRFKQNFPADFVCEAIDQTRGWFYSLHAISTLLFGRPCFRNVLCLGHVVDAEGEKMSKSKGNIVDPWTVINEYGADALRWYMLASAPSENTHRFSVKMLAETLRRDLLTLWNTYAFFVLYANIDRFVPQSGGSQSFSELDTWITSELNQLISAVTKAMDRYDPTSAARSIEAFVDDLSNWYVRRSRRRFWKSESDADKLAAHSTLYRCLVTLSQLLAPLTPFIAEEMYQNLVRSVYPSAAESVHLTDFPMADETMIDEELNHDMELAMRIASLGRAARAKAKIKVRQPLADAVVGVSRDRDKNALQRLSSHILEEVNVKELRFIEGETPGEVTGYAVASDEKYWVAVNTELSQQLVAEGIGREIVRRVQTMRRAADLDITDHITTYYQAEEPISQAMIDFGEYIRHETLSGALLHELPPEEAHVENHRIGTGDVLIGITKE
ncbi:MAG: isoleucine--tRNA ligase [Dehalococcoidia bacterium]|nr:isoleucine--tRNA ligase [Dehalococcoidia bacterium]